MLVQNARNRRRVTDLPQLFQDRSPEFEWQTVAEQMDQQLTELLSTSELGIFNGLRWALAVSIPFWYWSLRFSAEAYPAQ